jgi:hypothetical protein
MKTLKDHLILYDAGCPMCNLYTGAFVKTGMLDRNGRAAYQTAFDSCPQVDVQRAVNEIALVNRRTGEVTYGVKSLFTILGNACPLMKPLFASRLFTACMSRLYAFISYNRRVIIPAGENAHAFAWQPAFHKKYRIAYLIVTWLITASILAAYSGAVSLYVPQAGFYREFIFCGGQILFQGLVLLYVRKEVVWDYLGNMMTISLAGGLLLLPALALRSTGILSPSGCLYWFLAVAALMFAEHIRRSGLLKLGYIPTLTWMLYRMLLLLTLIL